MAEIKNQEKQSNYWTTARVNELMRKADEEGLEYKEVDNPFHENDPELKKGNILFDLTSEEIIEMHKCASDVIYFANKYCHVMTDFGVQQVVLRDYQEQILKQYQNNRFNIFLSPRQSGKTITSSIFLLWYLLFNSEKNAMILANVGDTAHELMDKIKTIMKKLPFFLKPGILLYNVGSMKFDNGCRIMAKTTTKSSSIGFTVHFLYMDEFAHVNPNFIGSFFKSVYPTIAASRISRIIITSTPNGLNKFYELYTDALEGKNSFNAIRVDWWQVPGRDEAWKQTEIANLGSEEDFNQEYGNQFLSSSRLLLDSFTLKRLKKGEVAFVHKELTCFNNTSIDYSELKWHPIFDPASLSESDDTKRFIVTVDTAAGVGGDYTVANIFKVAPLPLNLITEKKFYENESDFFCLLQVGMFRSNTMQPEEFKPFMEILCTNVLDPETVKIGIEIDFKGEMLIEKLLNGDKVFDEMIIFTKHYESSKQMKPGIKMTPSTKERYCEMLKSNCRAGRIIPTDRIGIGELGDFGENTKGNYSSQSGKDDIAMTCVIANSVFEYEDFQQMVQDIYDDLPQKYKDAIEKKMEEINIKGGGTSKDFESETWNVFKDFF